jgi:uncharacterized protein YkwD
MKQFNIIEITGLICTMILSLTSYKADNDIRVDKKEAYNAFIYLNDIRTNPDKYRAELKHGKTLKIAKTKLKWNDTLARVAEARAMDMVKRNYFDHVDPDGYGVNHYISKAGYKLEPDWTSDKADNSFESIQAGADDGQSAIKDLIVNDKESNYGHRDHLLGIDEWDKSLVDIGIGFVRDSLSEYGTYISIIIAKHHW